MTKTIKHDSENPETMPLRFALARLGRQFNWDKHADGTITITIHPPEAADKEDK